MPCPYRAGHHPGFLAAVSHAVAATRGMIGIVFGSVNAEGAASGGGGGVAAPTAEAMARNEIDLAQCVLRRDAIAAQDNRMDSSENGEAGFLARIFRAYHGRFAFSQEPVTYLKYLDAPEAERSLQSISFEDRDALPAHLGGHFQMTNMDEPVLAHLIREFRPRGFLDLGCGLGGMVLAARNRGLEALGIDGDPSVAPDILHDFAAGGISSAMLPPLPRPVLLWCVEFVEHVHERYLPHLLSVFERADVIFLTHAVPGQGGHHHVNERPAVYWVGVLAAIGFEIDEAASIACREVAVNQYTKATGLVFVKRQLILFILISRLS